MPTHGESDPDPVDDDDPPAVDDQPGDGPDDAGATVVPVNVPARGDMHGSSQIDGAAPAPACDHFDSIARFVRRELELPGKLLDGLALADVVHEQIDIVRELLDGLHCGKTATSGLLARLLAPAA